MAAIKFQTEAEWHAIREVHIGGSDVASLFNWWIAPDGSQTACHVYEQPPEGARFGGCLSSFKSSYRLWMEKAGKLMPDTFLENERVQAGIHFEPAIAAWAQERWPEWKIRKVRRYIEHPDFSGWGASLDYEERVKGSPPVEIKNTDSMVYRDEWAEDDGEVVGLPLPYLLQIQSQIGAAGASHGWILVCVGGNQLKRGLIERHEPSQKAIAEAITAFWRGVEADAEPTWLASYEAVGRLYAAGRAGSEALDLSGEDEFAGLCAAYTEAKARDKDIAAEVDHLKARIGRMLGESTKAFGDGWSVSWPAIHREGKLMPEKYSAALDYRGGMRVKERK